MSCDFFFKKIKLAFFFRGYKSVLQFSILVIQIGFSAPQGCGKTTLVFALDYLFRSTGRWSLNSDTTIILYKIFYLCYKHYQERHSCNKFLVHANILGNLQQYL